MIRKTQSHPARVITPTGSIQLCGYCFTVVRIGKHGPGGGQCGKCNRQYYCSKKCLRGHTALHNLVCKYYEDHTFYEDAPRQQNPLSLSEAMEFLEHLVRMVPAISPNKQVSEKMILEIQEVTELYEREARELISRVLTSPTSYSCSGIEAIWPERGSCTYALVADTVCNWPIEVLYELHHDLSAIPGMPIATLHELFEQLRSKTLPGPLLLDLIKTLPGPLLLDLIPRDLSVIRLSDVSQVYALHVLHELFDQMKIADFVEQCYPQDESFGGPPPLISNLHIELHPIPMSWLFEPAARELISRVLGHWI